MMNDKGESAGVDKTGASAAEGTGEGVSPGGDTGGTTTTTAATTGGGSGVLTHTSPAGEGTIIHALDGVGGGTLSIRVQNMSLTANLGIRLDLKKIALKCRNTEFSRRRYGAIIMRLREPNDATALIFASGKICISGVNSIHNAKLARIKIAHIIERIGYKPKEFTDDKVENIVGTIQCGFQIRLEALVYAHSAFASYEPELFPGLIYRLVRTSVVFLIFVSGKVVITGAKKDTDLSNALTKLYPILLEFKKVHVASLPGLPPGSASSPQSSSVSTDPTTGTTSGKAVE